MVTLSSAEAFMAELDEGLGQPGRDRSTHPFVEACADGTVTLAQYAGWLHQQSLWANPTNKLLGALYTACPDDDLRMMVLENLMEEELGTESGGSGHVQLFTDALVEMGWTDADFERDVQHPESWALAHWFEVAICNRPFVEAICALSYTAERLNPIIFTKIEEGLRKHLDLSDRALRPISVHASHIEEEHGTLGPKAIERYATTGAARDAVRFSVFHTAEIYYNQYNVWTKY